MYFSQIFNLQFVLNPFVRNIFKTCKNVPKVFGYMLNDRIESSTASLRLVKE